jgi:hypothetical protein
MGRFLERNSVERIRGLIRERERGIPAASLRAGLVLPRPMPTIR